MRFTPLPLQGAFRVDIEPRGDNRGFFARLFCSEEFAFHDLNLQWVQCNMSYSSKRGTLRGLHFQQPPMAEIKLVRCTKGSIWDVIVDLREGSPTYGQWYSETLNEKNRSMLYIPKGLAHGFQTLTDDVEMLYFHSTKYSAEHEAGLRWDDPVVGVDWPLKITDVSDRDSALPNLHQLEPLRI